MKHWVAYAIAGCLALMGLLTFIFRENLFVAFERKYAIQDVRTAGVSRANGGVWESIRPLLLAKLESYSAKDAPVAVYAWANPLPKDGRVSLSIVWVSSGWSDTRVDSISVLTSSEEVVRRFAVQAAEYDKGGRLYDFGPVYEYSEYVSREEASVATSIAVCFSSGNGTGKSIVSIDSRNLDMLPPPSK